MQNKKSSYILIGPEGKMLKNDENSKQQNSNQQSNNENESDGKTDLSPEDLTTRKVL
jgi:hypothetical protein